MKNKIIVGAILGVLALVFVFLGGAPLLCLCLVAVAMGLWEYYGLLKQKQLKPLVFPGIAIGLLFVVVAYITMGTKNLLWGGASLGSVVILAVFAVLVIQFVQIAQRRERYSILDLSITIFGSIYIGGFISFVFPLLGVGIRQFGDTPMSRLVILIPLWTSSGADVGAYFFGKYLGKTKVFPDISPNKTLEGFLGGMLVSVVGVFFIGVLLKIPMMQSIFLGLIACMAGQVGDLSESALKRELGIKDSGKTLASHGGFLDRLDSILFTMPVVYYFIIWFVPWAGGG